MAYITLPGTPRTDLPPPPYVVQVPAPVSGAPAVLGEQIPGSESQDPTQTVALTALPPGLELLLGIDTLLVKQDLELVELLTDFETNNRYQVINGFGQRVFLAAESTHWCSRNCYGMNRPFLIRMFAPNGSVVAVIERRCSCSLCFWGGGIAGSDITVRSSSGELFGSVVQNCNCCTPSYAVLDGQGRKVMKIRGPDCGAGCSCVMCCDAQFTITSTGANKEQIGFIQKTFGEQELISNANYFGVRFISNLDPVMKCVVLGAVFCIDFSFFESSRQCHCCSCPGCCWVVTGIVLVALFMACIAIAAAAT